MEDDGILNATTDWGIEDVEDDFIDPATGNSVGMATRNESRDDSCNENRQGTRQHKRSHREDDREYARMLENQRNADRQERVHSWTSSSPMARSPFVKPPEFPKDVPVLEKLDNWLDWKTVLQASLDLAGVTSQKSKANFLILTVGQELRTTISMNNMSSSNEHDSYDKLVQNIENYLRQLTDPTANATAFTSARQGPGETARDFEIRVRRMASRCDAGIPEDFIKSQFVKGMKNRKLATQACVEALPMQEIVIRETRIETQERQECAGSPWKPNEFHGASEVAAVTFKKEFRTKRFRPYDRQERMSRPRDRDNWSRDAEMHPQKRVDYENQAQQSKTQGDCTRCGFTHRSNVCPAEGSRCSRCDGMDHYARMCQSSVNDIDDGSVEPNQQKKGKENQYDSE